jgi:hypothetical protein
MQSTQSEGLREQFRPSPPPEPAPRRNPLQSLRGYAGMRVSWSAVVAGAVAMLGTALLLWALALGIVAAATGPSEASLRGGTVALWVCAMVAVLVGSVVGGAVTGFLRGSGREYLGASHGLLAWGLAFVLAFGFQLYAMKDLARVATAPLHETTTAAPAVIQRLLRVPGETGATSTVVDRSRDALRNAAGIGWSSFFVWIVAGALAAGASEIVARRVIGRRDVLEAEREPERGRGEPMVPSPGA